MHPPNDHGQADRLALATFVKLMRAAETVAIRTHRHLAAHRLTASQFGVLEALFHLGPLHQREIARKILKSSGNITMVIDNLEKRGLVLRRRRPDDRRYSTIELTEAGRGLIREIFPRHKEEIVREFQILTKEEQRELGRICRKLGTGE